MKKWTTLGRALTPDGKPLVLAERDGLYALRIGGIELMTNRQCASEERLAQLACPALGPGARVLVGGLGFGFTLRSVLERAPADCEVVVAELIPEVVAWNRDPALPLASAALADRRVKIEVRDVAEVIGEATSAFDAILLDVDNGPSALSAAGNDRLYRDAGLRAIARALRPGGRMAVWSVEEAPAFARRLEKNGLTAEAHRVRAHSGGGGQRWIYLGVRR